VVEVILEILGRKMSTCSMLEFGCSIDSAIANPRECYTFVTTYVEREIDASLLASAHCARVRNSSIAKLRRDYQGSKQREIQGIISRAMYRAIVLSRSRICGEREREREPIVDYTRNIVSSPMYLHQ